MNRVEIRALRLVVEWDEVTGELWVGCGMEDQAARAEVVQGLWGLVFEGAGTLGEEVVVERTLTGGGCFDGTLGAGGSGTALVLRVTLADPGDGERIARAAVRAFELLGPG